MKILTLDNRTYKLEKIPEWVDENLRFAVLDNSNPEEPDFFYIPLIFLESFNAPAAVLEIGPHKIKMPLDWKMLIGEAGQQEMHVLPITSLNDRGFEALLDVPLPSYSRGRAQSLSGNRSQQLYQSQNFLIGQYH